MRYREVLLPATLFSLLSYEFFDDRWNFDPWRCSTRSVNVRVVIVFSTHSEDLHTYCLHDFNFEASKEVIMKLRTAVWLCAI